MLTMTTNQPPRPQIGIDRLPPRRTTSEPRELMNCKSCRKRKIKCNRLRPSCEACQVFAIPCVYDAVPKKRGPKTDVLEALLKRIDGLEKQLKPDDKKTTGSSAKEDNFSKAKQLVEPKSTTVPSGSGSLPSITDVSSNISPSALDSAEPAVSPINKFQSVIQSYNRNYTSKLMGFSQAMESQATDINDINDHLIRTFFSRIHGRPFHTFEEGCFRRKWRNSALPSHLLLAVYSMSARVSNIFGDREQAIMASEHYAHQARQTVDIDEPQLDNLLTFVLLSQHAFQTGKGKKAYMYLSTAVSMAYALNLHRELPGHIQLSTKERDLRRRAFWTCYLLDRFYACGSKRPCFIPDECVVLRLPCVPGIHGMLTESNFFSGTSSLQHMGGLKSSQDPTGMFIEVVRILGITNRYLAAGGPKADSHFPWHALSMLSKIRQELDVWAGETRDTFASIDVIFGHSDSTVLILSKLIYHLIHCLIYRPFLPVDLFELSGTSQNQSWRIEATNMCFLHANAITELVEIWKARSTMTEWPAFVGYCACTAGTIHIHGSFYRGGEGQVFSQSQEFFSLEVRQLAELRYVYAGVQHQLDTLQSIYVAHSELARTMASNGARVPPVVNYDDFFDRYQGQVFDGAFLVLANITLSPEITGMQPRHESQEHFYRSGAYPKAPMFSYSYDTIEQPAMTLNSSHEERPRKRRATMSSSQAFPGNPAQGQSVAESRHRAMTLASPRPSPATQPLLQTQFSSPTPDSADPSINQFGFTPPITYSTTPTTISEPSNATFDPVFSVPTQFEDSPRVQTKLTPGMSTESSEPTNSTETTDLTSATTINSVVSDTEADNDPFLVLLEQLAENNEYSRNGRSEIDFLLGSN